MKVKHFVILCSIVFIGIWLAPAMVNAQEKLEYPVYKKAELYPVNLLYPFNAQERVLTFRESETIDQDSVLVIFSAQKLLGLLKEYQAYCDTVTIGKWEYVAMPITMPDSTIRWVMDSTLVRFPRKQYRNLMFLFPEDFVNWLENVKLK